MPTNRKAFLFIATSLDGYIATRDNDLGFLSMVEQEGQDYGYADFTATVDTIILGRKTYDKVLEMGHEYPGTGARVFVISRTPRPAKGNVQYHTGDLAAFVAELKNQPGKNIYCDGGAEIANELMRHNLIDEYIVSVIPVLLGDGIRLFADGRPEQRLELVSATPYEKGLVQLHYRLKKP